MCQQITTNSPTFSIIVSSRKSVLLTDLVQIQAIQNKTRNALEEYVRLNRPESSGRFGQLLIKLTSLGAVEPHIIEHVFFNKLIGGASINNLVDDILRANTLISHAKNSAV